MNRFLLVVAFAIAPSLSQNASAERVEFNRDIRPILSDNCFYCHGFDEAHREAGLRLDTFEGATESDAIVPCDPDESELMRRILSDDPDEVMPPPDSERSLSTQQRELVSRWIEQGAEYQEHWAWTPLQRPQVPGATPSSPSDAVDAFLEQGWAKNGLAPASDASPRELLRRLSFDLRGLPPTADEVSRFEADASVEHLLRFRETWMSELSFAEHQAVRWLDLVRWADTSGFVSDEPIASGAYRSWVINAIRDNMPFDEFSISQLAGDLLPNPTDGDLIASGYNRIVNTNCEAGAIEAEQLYKLKGEHVRAFGTVWMGLTTGCAECHDHKFDPILAKDYYRLAAFFDDLVEAGVYTPGDRREPLHYVYEISPRSEEDRRLASKIETLQKRISQKSVDDLSTWEDDVLGRLNDETSRRDFVWIPSELPAMRVLEGSFEFATIDERCLRETTTDNGAFRRHHAAELMTGYINHGSFKTDAEKDGWYVDVWLDKANRPEMLGIQLSHGDYGRLGWKTANYETYYWGDDTSGVLQSPQSWSDPARVKRIGDLPTENGWVRLRVPFSERIPAVSGQDFEAVGMAWLQTGGRVLWGDSGLELRSDKATELELGETAIRKWWERPMNRQVYERRLKYVAAALKSKPVSRDDLQNEMIQDVYRESTQPKRMENLRRLESRLWQLRSRAMPVLVSQQGETKKMTRLLNRGDYQDETGPLVSSATPEFLGIPITTEEPSRLDLAKWLFDERNPLTARVYVNRLWHQFFGRGISKTLDDSGTQGEWPSNVALLDWLACEFRDSGWDRNHMIRLLTSTRAYRLSSKPTEQQTKIDPENRMQARQSRFRLPAESIRDAALKTAGLLEMHPNVPTHSFYPYQPGQYWTTSDKVMFGSRHLDWTTSREQSQYSRSLYTFWKRQNIHPTMLAFDAPTRQECTAQRNITNTPGQALALLNDPIFVEAARVFASQVVESGESSDDAKLDHAFEAALQRSANDEEKRVLRQLLDRQRQHYRRHLDDAASLISIGQAPLVEDMEPAELAAWTTVTRVILNLHEFLNRS
ncbi:PSD1 and planctomycete cytochrome C domain-containing protein [Aporhodopirellula aestuarii]|uniref:PSD1 and planctomycete cytochrome C domain-containing protein n=1 Tax=Aporhodopirellula aestuarii TaxID=2950107 RepID=A0ABT0U4C3_9BACT|nr:PSD1 and planctomycete cytochrome C domain-containing protein [Aporhodopirellula aestuarii]MCM2371782.1 PSD1 and planctomycete cytochrome C domain-containing protein [Aporhodopirellula aestuarii]